MPTTRLSHPALVTGAENHAGRGLDGDFDGRFSHEERMRQLAYAQVLATLAVADRLDHLARLWPGAETLSGTITTPAGLGSDTAGYEA
jgi:hypothetical protein